MAALKPDRFGREDFADCPIAICGKAFRAHMSGALYWPGEKALIVSDLHLATGKRSMARGQMLAACETRETLAKLADVIDTYDAATVIVLGNSLDGLDASGQMDGQDRETLKILQEDREWIWIAGSHDPGMANEFGGTVVRGLKVEGITLAHKPRAGAVTHEIAGHLHPAARLVMHGTAIRRLCFAGNGYRLIMPAFGASTGGLNILDAAFEPLFGHDGMKVWMLGQEGLYPVATRLLRED